MGLNRHRPEFIAELVAEVARLYEEASERIIPRASQETLVAIVLAGEEVYAQLCKAKTNLRKQPVCKTKTASLAFLHDYSAISEAEIQTGSSPS